MHELVNSASKKPEAKIQKQAAIEAEQKKEPPKKDSAEANEAGKELKKANAELKEKLVEADKNDMDMFLKDAAPEVDSTSKDETVKHDADVKATEITTLQNELDEVEKVVTDDVKDAVNVKASADVKPARTEGEYAEIVEMKSSCKDLQEAEEAGCQGRDRRSCRGHPQVNQSWFA